MRYFEMVGHRRFAGAAGPGGSATGPRGLAAGPRRLAACATLVGALAGAAPAAAQIGAFGGAPATPAAGDDVGHHSAPILMESAVFSPHGTLGGALVFGVTSGSVDVPGVAFDYRVTQTAASVHYAVSDRAVVGAALQPWNQLYVSAGGASESESGRGDASLFGKLRVWESEDGRSAAAVSGALGLPLGESGFGAEGVSIGAGLALSRQLDEASLHGSVGATLPTDDADGELLVSLSGGGMYRAGERVSVGAELLARFSDGEYVADLAPGLRFQATPRVMVDAAFLVNVATSLPGGIYDGGLLLAVRFGG